MVSKTILLSAGLIAMVFEGVMHFRHLPICNDSYEYKATNEIFVNPLMGYAPSATQENRYPASSLVYVDITWRELEPEEGRYNWEAIEEENHLKKWRQLRKHVVLRFICDLPSDIVHMDIPDWLYEKTEHDGKHYDMEYGKGYAPNYQNQILIQYHAKAIHELGEHFRTDSFISYVELGSLGHWGEWHVKADSGVPSIPERNIREQYIVPYIEAFPQAKILTRRPFQESKDCGFGVYNDMTGDYKDTKTWLGWIDNGGDYDQTSEVGGLSAMPNIWNHAPVGGEFTSNLSMNDILGEHLERTMDLINQSHMTFIGPKIPPVDSTGELSMEAMSVIPHMGYRLRVSKMKIKRTLFSKKTSIKLTWINDGTAPLYWNWPAYLYLYNQNGNCEKIKLDICFDQLSQGMTAETTAIVASEKMWGEVVALGVGIEDPQSGEPSITLPMEAERRGNISILWSR
ncbi:MAG: DUF4832 domain-containing protein [Clostridium sp.]